MLMLAEVVGGGDGSTGGAATARAPYPGSNLAPATEPAAAAPAPPPLPEAGSPDPVEAAAIGPRQRGRGARPPRPLE